MNYIYDIVLNFNKEYYSFYEWNRKDNIINVKKIPLFLVDNECFNIMKYDNVCVRILLMLLGIKLILIPEVNLVLLFLFLMRKK